MEWVFFTSDWLWQKFRHMLVTPDCHPPTPREVSSCSYLTKLAVRIVIGLLECELKALYQMDV